MCYICEDGSSHGSMVHDNLPLIDSVRQSQLDHPPFGRGEGVKLIAANTGTAISIPVLFSSADH
jgi:hypothetical protein